MEETSRGPGDLPVILFDSVAEWTTWLEQHHASAPGTWLRIAKKGSSIRSVTYAEAVEAALRYGWIDSQALKHDEHTYLQRFTPRRARSVWSKINREKAEALIASGAMRPAGLRAVEEAQKNGRWAAAYDSPATATVPADLQAAFDENPAAAAFFATLDSRNRYAILQRLQSVKKPETRARRIAQFVAMLANGEKLYP